jgi:hypothetical protein
MGARIAAVLVLFYCLCVARPYRRITDDRVAQYRFSGSQGANRSMIGIGDLVYGVKKTFGLNRGGRNFPVYPDDRFLVSYPRSGNTWTRFLIANLLFQDREVSFLNIDHLIPDVININRRQLARVQRPRLIKSHEYFDPRYKRVIYIVRDPRDVVTSYYYFLLKQGFIADGYPFDTFIRRFVEGDVDPEFASWGENVVSWVASRGGQSGFLLLKYEDIKVNPVQELAKVGDFLGIPHDSANLTRAVKLSSADRMRELEQRDEDQWIGTRAKRKDIRFVRTAITGGWRSSLSEDNVARIENAWAPIMKTLGYEPVTRCKEFRVFTMGASHER